MSTLVQEREQTLHVRLDGRSAELPLAGLDIDRQATDEAIKQAVAVYFGRPVDALQNHVVARHSTAIVVRPEAIYG